MLYENPDDIDGRTCWCHPKPECLVQAKLKGFTDLVLDESAPWDDWQNRFSICIGCGKSINKPKAKRCPG